MKRERVRTGTAFLILLAFLVPAGGITVAGAVDEWDILFTPPNAEPVHFSHDYHTDVRGVKCMACHFRMFEEKAGSYAMNREKMTKADFCEYCHNGMKGFDVRSTQNCVRCHRR